MNIAARVVVLVMLVGCNLSLTVDDIDATIGFDPALYSVSVRVVDQFGAPVVVERIEVGYYTDLGSASELSCRHSDATEVAFTDDQGVATFSRLPGLYFCVRDLRDHIAGDGSAFRNAAANLGLHVKPAPTNITREAIMFRVPTTEELLASISIVGVEGFHYGGGAYIEAVSVGVRFDYYGRVTPVGTYSFYGFSECNGVMVAVSSSGRPGEPYSNGWKGSVDVYGVSQAEPRVFRIDRLGPVYGDTGALPKPDRSACAGSVDVGAWSFSVHAPGTSFHIGVPGRVLFQDIGLP